MADESVIGIQEVTIRCKVDRELSLGARGGGAYLPALSVSPSRLTPTI
jgi:hypothetical protein